MGVTKLRRENDWQKADLPLQFRFKGKVSSGAHDGRKDSKKRVPFKLKTPGIRMFKSFSEYFTGRFLGTEYSECLACFKHLFGNQCNFPPFRENEQNTYIRNYGRICHSKRSEPARQLPRSQSQTPTADSRGEAPFLSWPAGSARRDPHTATETQPHCNLTRPHRVTRPSRRLPAAAGSAGPTPVQQANVTGRPAPSAVGLHPEVRNQSLSKPP